MSVVNDLRLYLRMLFRYEPKRFWNDLLSNSFNLRGVGHYRLSEEENRRLYELKREALEAALRDQGITVDATTRVLEVGTGVGFWTDFFAARGVRDYTGNDIAEVSVRRLRERHPGYTFILGDIAGIALPERHFDLAAVIDVTQHITDDRAFARAMDTVWRAVREGGHLVVTIWDPARNVHLANRLRINRIEKPRGFDAYLAVLGPSAEVRSRTDFNDKDLLIIRKAA